ncbi:LPS assembly lipoprotein LptE [Thiobacter aerophilum]|uniref:LPS-assembly lipoprotein LptE n=1 Tax=Thiobacter aerophilum TaxID=3121275 RepID=A0ABV0ECA5_9BURK
MLPRVIGFCLLLVLAGCGFALRGAASLPYQSLYIENAGPEMGVELARAIRTTDTRVVDDPAKAQAVLQVLSQQREKQILSISGAGRVSEYRLLYRVTFRVRDAAGKELLPVQSIELARELTYDASRALAKEAEEAVLYRDMQSDAVQQILRRLAGRRPTF